MYRVIYRYRVYCFDDYAEAKKFKLENGGVIYEKCFSTAGDN